MLQVADVRHRIGLELALADVAGTDPNRVELVEHVELGERNRTDAVEGDAVARHHAIEPSHPPRPTRVVYALKTPIVRSTAVGEIPEPVSAPPALGDDDVTYG